MYVDLVSAKTSDCITRNDSLRDPVRRSKNNLPVDVLICLHGVAGDFYGSDMIKLEELPALAAELSNFSCAVISDGDHFATGQRGCDWGIMRDWHLSL